VDPVLFENFLTGDGDLLRAKFQAFKFPETNFVLFKGIVNVCLDRCNGVQCSNGQVGYGRKRRDVNDEPAQQQRVYEVSMSTVVKVSDQTTERLVTADSQGKLAKKTFVSEEAVISEIYRDPDELANARLAEAFGPSQAKYIDFQIDNGASSKSSTLLLVCLATLLGVATLL